mgnify:CR=1 FL=1
MKKIFRLAALAFTTAALAAVSCAKESEPNKEPETPPEPEKPKPALVNAEVTIAPDGETKTYKLVAAEDWYTQDWRIEESEEQAWLSVNPTSGTGDAEISLYAEGNETGKARSVSLYVKIGDYDAVEIFVSQAKKESNVNESDLEFLKAVVEGRMLGDATPEVTDWYNVDPGVFPGIGMTDKDGKFYVTAFDGAAFTNFPEKMVLPELTLINLRGKLDDNGAFLSGLAGKRLPKEWDTPKLTKINVSNNGLVGPIPDGLAASPLLAEMYMDGNRLFGALPHNWASKVIEVAILANVYNVGASATLPKGTLDNAKLGYMVPASLDVIFNQDRKSQGDKTQMKLGGATECTYIGFEKGWGQARYEKYDPEAKKGDTAVWSDFRLLCGSTAEGFDKDLDNWAWFFSNIGYPGYGETIPHVMLDWDQAAADAYTAKCEEEYKASLQ